MPGSRSSIEERLAGTVSLIQRFYPWHRNAFVAFNVGVTLLNIYSGPPWWGLWPLLISGLVFTLHYLVFKASVIDDAWVDERASDLHYKSYDQGHIDFIADRHGLDQVNDRLIKDGQKEKQRRDPDN